MKKERWVQFEKDAELLGSDRSKLINEFIEMIQANPELWSDVRAIAGQRRESLSEVVLAGLRAYRKRNARHLPAEGSDDEL